MKKLLVTGSAGLVGSEVCAHFDALGWSVSGIDSNQRAVFFGPGGDTRWNLERLQKSLRRYTHYDLDIRNRPGIFRLVEDVKPHAIVHAAAQPSHDHAAAIPFDDFETNAVGTLNLLEAVRQFCPNAVFVHLSTNKVYGDAPNRIKLKELATRWDYDDPLYAYGIAEDFPIDQSMHSLFGASKLAADILVQEYGRYFGIPSCCLRCGCVTGPNQACDELHGFLSYLIKCNVEGRLYRVFGYSGKQVRDNIHACDVARFIEAFVTTPRCAEVYNLGGSRRNSCSILEAFERVTAITGRAMRHEYQDKPRDGDHVCYISDLAKVQAHYPTWEVTLGLDDIFRTIAESRRRHLV